MAIQHLQMFFDVATCHSSDTHLLTDGKVAADLEEEKCKCPGAAHLVKVEREKDFPLDVMEQAFVVNLERAQATDPQDRTRILNSLVGRTGTDPDLEPISDHDAYVVVNKRIWATFAVATWRQVFVLSPVGG